jgi:hypothetical protein
MLVGQGNQFPEESQTKYVHAMKFYFHNNLLGQLWIQSPDHLQTIRS